MKKLLGRGSSIVPSIGRQTDVHHPGARHAQPQVWKERRTGRRGATWAESTGNRFVPTARCTWDFTHTSISLTLDPVSDLAWIKKKENP